MIAGGTCVNKRRYVTWVTIGICGRCEIIYTKPTTDTESLEGVSLQSVVLGVDTVSHEDWPPVIGP